MMHLNTDALVGPAITKKPCWRDLHVLVTTHLPEAVVKLALFEELERRCAEINAEHPRFQEETPVVLREEARRRARHQGLQVGSRTPATLTASQGYFHA